MTMPRIPKTRLILRVHAGIGPMPAIHVTLHEKFEEEPSAIFSLQWYRPSNIIGAHQTADIGAWCLAIRWLVIVGGLSKTSFSRSALPTSTLPTFPPLPESCRIPRLYIHTIPYATPKHCLTFALVLQFSPIGELLSSTAQLVPSHVSYALQQLECARAARVFA